MKRFLVPGLLVLSSLVLLNGCVAAIGNRDAQNKSAATVGQQMIDLQRARDAGAITQAEFDAQKARVLGTK